MEEITYKQSGALGDLIYSLVTIAKLGKGELKIAMNNLATCCKGHGYNVTPNAIGVHAEDFTESQYNFIKPLLERQPYITGVSQWHAGDPATTVDLDQFRGTLFKRFEGNYLESFYITHNIPYTEKDVHHFKWLVADSIKVRPIVVARSPRYHDIANGDTNHKLLAEHYKFTESAIFLGNAEEHADYEKVIGMPIMHYKVRNALEMASVINGADLIISNQTFAFSLAMGLGKTAICEYQKTKPLEYNECCFNRTNVQYL